MGGRIDHTPLKQPGIIASRKQCCACMAQRSLRLASAAHSRLHTRLFAAIVRLHHLDSHTPALTRAMASATIAGRCNCHAPLSGVGLAV